MKRARRYIVNGLTILSLLLCTATVVLWVRSYSTAETFGWYRDHWIGETCYTRVVASQSDSGGILLAWLRREYTPRQLEGEQLFRSITPESNQLNYHAEPPIGYPYRHDYPGWSGLGFGAYAGERTPPYVPIGVYYPGEFLCRDVFLVVPHAAAIGLFLAWPAFRMRKHLRQRNRASSGCTSCGYDLRATPDRCPECGVSVPTAEV